MRSARTSRTDRPKLDRGALDAVLNGAVEAGQVPGVVAAVTDPVGCVYEGVAGLARASGPRPMDVDGIFRIASMTKAVTSLAVMMLVDEGRVDLDVPLAAYLASYRQPDVLESFDARTGAVTTSKSTRPVTVRQLLTHTSGYGYWFVDAPLRAVCGDRPDPLQPPPFLVRMPGEKFGYGTSTDIVGQVVESVSGRRLEEFFSERIFGPLDMVTSGFDLPADQDRLVAAHYRANGAFRERAIERSGNPPRGGGGLYSTASDWLSFMRLFLNRGRAGGVRLIDRAAIESMSENQIGERVAERQATIAPGYSNDFLFLDGGQRFGFGFAIETRGQPGGRAAGSYGWAGIWNTYFWVDPRAGIGAVLLMQVSPFADPACIDVYRRFEQALYGEITAVPAPGV